MKEQNISLKEKLVGFLTENPSSLDSIYNKFDEEKKSTIRGRLNENINKCFKRISKGVYLSQVGEAQALIVEGDSWKEIKKFPDNSVDTIFADSPYDCLNKHLATGTTRKKTNEWSFETRNVDEKLLKEIFRVLKPNGHFFNFLPCDSKDTYDYNSNFVKIAREAGFEFNKAFIWDKVYFGMGYSGRNRYEQIMFMSKGKRRMPHNKSIADVLPHKRLKPSEKINEAQKPVELLLDLIKFSCISGDLAVDLFGGSFPVAKACLEYGVHSVSIEKDKKMVSRGMESINLKKVELE